MPLLGEKLARSVVRPEMRVFIVDGGGGEVVLDCSEAAAS